MVKFLDASNVQELTKGEQKLILGGFSSDCCFYVTGPPDGSDDTYNCTNNSAWAEQHASGRYHTWACGTDEASSRCGC